MKQMMEHINNKQRSTSNDIKERVHVIRGSAGSRIRGLDNPLSEDRVVTSLWDNIGRVRPRVCGSAGRTIRGYVGRRSWGEG